MTIYKKILEIQKIGVKADKDGKNPHFRSSYVTLDNLLGVILPLASDNGLVVVNYVQDRTLVTDVVDTETGEKISSSFPIASDDPQKAGSAITYGKRYNLGAIFNLITEIDDDGNYASGHTERSTTRELTTELSWYNNFEKDRDQMQQMIIN